MMTQLRQKTAVILWFVILAFVALIVVEWGADYSRTSHTSGAENVGVINGRPIGAQEFQTALKNVARQQSREQRQDQGALVRQVWDAMVRDRVLGQEMDRLGIQVTDKEVAYLTRMQPPQAVRDLEVFQTNGQFDQAKYTQFMGDPANLQNPTNKMSKSADSPQGTINLLDDLKAVEKKIMRAVTDTETEVRYDVAAKPGVSNLLSILAACTGRTPEDAAQGYTQYGALKKDTAAAVVETLRPVQARFAELSGDPAETARLVGIGASKASAIAAPVLARAKEHMGFLPR